jgi:hypothetical protein
VCCARHSKRKSIDILNAVNSVSTTKVLLGELRNNGWEPLLKEVKLFCGKHEIDIPDLNKKYVFPQIIYSFVKLYLFINQSISSHL